MSTVTHVLPDKYVKKDLGGGAPYLHNNFNNFRATVAINGIKGKLKSLFNKTKRESSKILLEYAKAAEGREKNLIAMSSLKRGPLLERLNGNLQTDSVLESYKKMKSVGFGKYKDKDATNAAFKKKLTELNDAFELFKSATSDYSDFLETSVLNSGQTKSKFNRYTSSLNKYEAALRGLNNSGDYTKKDFKKFISASIMPLGWVLEPVFNTFFDKQFNEIFPDVEFETLTTGAALDKKTTADIVMKFNNKDSISIDVKSSTVNKYKNQRNYRGSGMDVFKNAYFRYVYMNYMYSKIMRNSSLDPEIEKYVMQILMIEAVAKGIVGIGYEMNAAKETFVAFPSHIMYMSDFFKKVSSKIDSSTIEGGFSFGRIDNIRTGVIGEAKKAESRVKSRFNDFNSMYLTKINGIKNSSSKEGGYKAIILNSSVRDYMKNFYSRAVAPMSAQKQSTGFRHLLSIDSIR